MAGNGTTPTRATKAELVEQLSGYEMSFELIQERLVDLELALEDAGWRKLSDDVDTLLDPDMIMRVITMAQGSYLTNPLIHHAVTVQANYVFAQGITVRAKPGEEVNEALQKFWDDPSNQRELTTLTRLWEKEVQLSLEANLFFVLFTDRLQGRVQVRTIPVSEIINGGEIICNPEDHREPWFYKRVWTPRTFEAGSGKYELGNKTLTAYYPDWRYQPPPESRATSINEKPVYWDQPVYHVAVGNIGGKPKFGIPEIYSALDWARAVRLDLEDYATIKRALARFAWSIKTKGGKTGVATAKSKLESALGTATGGLDTNPPPVAGSALLLGSQEAAPVRTAGSTISPEEGRRLWLMVSAGVGIPETILSGNADVGNMATAKTLDRPTELQMRMRQQLWKQIIKDIGTYVIENASLAAGNKLQGDVTDGIILLRPRKRQGGRLVEQKVEIEVSFPSILERDKKVNVDAIVDAATLKGKVSTGMFPQQDLTSRILEALAEDDIDGALAKIAQEGTSAPATEAPPAEQVPVAEAASTVRMKYDDAGRVIEVTEVPFHGE